jgi:hypothetical protein
MVNEEENPDAIDLDAAQTQVQEHRLLEEMDRDGEIAQLNKLLQDEGFRDFMWRVLSRCNIYQTTYQKNFGDMALMEGMRQIGLWLLKEICEADPQAQIVMQQKSNRLAHEASQKQAANRRRRRSSTTG